MNQFYVNRKAFLYFRIHLGGENINENFPQRKPAFVVVLAVVKVEGILDNGLKSFEDRAESVLELKDKVFVDGIPEEQFSKVA